MKTKRTTREQWKAITCAVKRFVELRKSAGMPTTLDEVEWLEIALDMVNRATPLDLYKLADEFDDFNLVHDLTGIMKHVNPDGTLRNCFVPRCSKPMGKYT